MVLRATLVLALCQVILANISDSDFQVLYSSLHTLQKDGRVIVAFANAGYMDFVLSWALSLDRFAVENFAVIPLDADAQRMLEKKGLGDHTVALPSIISRQTSKAHSAFGFFPPRPE